MSYDPDTYREVLFSMWDNLLQKENLSMLGDKGTLIPNYFLISNNIAKELHNHNYSDQIASIWI